jgi:hypothetical protein
MYFSNFQRSYPPIDRSLRANLPRWDWLKNVTLPSTIASAGRSVQSQAYHWLLELLAINPSHVVAFFTEDRKWSLQWIAQTVVQCDLAAVITCSRHDKDLIMSTVIFAVLYLMIWITASAMGMNYLATLFLLSYPAFILWYAFGMAPTCFPMLPPCLLADIIATLESLVPPAIKFPPELMCDAGRTYGPLNQTCLRSCSELGFNSWVDPLAFAICDTDTRTCAFLQDLGPSGEGYFDSLIWNRLRSAMAEAQKIISTRPDLAAWRMCTWVTFIWVVPAIVILVGITVIASAVLAFVFDLLPALVTFLGQAYVFYES